mgnify:CR=1 FL=1|jgi:hypothetical protein
MATYALTRYTAAVKVGLLGLCVCAIGAQADLQRRIEINATQEAKWNPVDDSWQTPHQLSGQLALNTSGSSTLKSYLHLSANSTEPHLTLDKAYAKMRWEGNRITLGKTALGWGQGTVFNAGDVVTLPNQPSPLLAPPTDHRWLGTFQHPLGRFSFYEIAVVAPATSEAIPTASADQFTVAARHQFQMASWHNNQIETGMAWQGTSQQLMPYISLQGGSGLNWHVSARAEIDNHYSITRQLVTAGVYGLWSRPQSSTWNYRLETVWDSAGATTERANGYWYRHLLQGSLSLGISSRSSAFAQVMLSPIDQSSLTSLGMSSNLRQGFTLNATLSLGQGDVDDVFSHRRTGAIAFRSNLRYAF